MSKPSQVTDKEAVQEEAKQLPQVGHYSNKVHH